VTDEERARRVASDILAPIKIASEPSRGRAVFVDNAFADLTTPEWPQAELQKIIMSAENGDGDARAAVHTAIAAFVQIGPLQEFLQPYLFRLLEAASVGPSKRGQSAHNNYAQ
jgi:hypothetical protein